MDVEAEDKGMNGMRGKHTHIPTDKHIREREDQIRRAKVE